MCKEEGKEVPWQEIVKSYDLGDGQFVVLTEEDFEKADLKKSNSIEVIDFVDECDIDPVYYETPYYLEAEKGAGKAYTLFREALKKSKKVGIGNYVLRNHEHLAVVRPYGDFLVLNQMRYNAELVKPTDLKKPSEAQPTKKEMDMAIQLIDQLSKPFNPADYEDTYTAELKELIEQKAHGKKVKVKKGEEAPTGKVHDIMSLLKESLDKSKKESPEKGKRKTKSRRTA